MDGNAQRTLKIAEATRPRQDGWSSTDSVTWHVERVVRECKLPLAAKDAWSELWRLAGNRPGIIETTPGSIAQIVFGEVSEKTATNIRRQWSYLEEAKLLDILWRPPERGTRDSKLWRLLMKEPHESPALHPVTPGPERDLPGVDWRGTQDQSGDKLAPDLSPPPPALNPGGETPRTRARSTNTDDKDEVDGDSGVSREGTTDDRLAQLGQQGGHEGIRSDARAIAWRLFPKGIKGSLCPDDRSLILKLAMLARHHRLQPLIVEGVRRTAHYHAKKPCAYLHTVMDELLAGQRLVLNQVLAKIVVPPELAARPSETIEEVGIG